VKKDDEQRRGVREKYFLFFLGVSGYEKWTGRVSGLGVFERRMQLAEGEKGKEY